ncbi:transcriptional regulator [Ameyamaea chiangmaiensis NBRC 103196]|uniref:Transcriptional regulator n=1 Tax=Ameyamaea chiangmaiensis TaxID=442969 RepID=A0A850P5E0_9PROT|nr:helix-turn-helix domain-containing protein [Ameyamaea chiangmaiensis]MBS4074215.1 hypothetical protein [Ameyamaea chiangmaiensis]NVN39158.1 hypothetical protein [Ameyamaea chiangmaiensis]GBQ71272.1 transcriptional regulator [Ameyamaea chiangmaiensis NBRC 103196]
MSATLHTHTSRSPANAFLASSWQRCESRYHLDPSTRKITDLLSSHEVRYLCDRAGPLLSAALPEMQRLITMVGDMGFTVLLADPHGVVIARQSSAQTERGCRKWHLWTGGVWDEATEGTNGVGTCLAEEKAALVVGREHWRWSFHALTCLAVPLYDAQGRLVGALDISAMGVELPPGCLKLLLDSLSQAARRIEMRLFRACYDTHMLVMIGEESGSSAPVLAIEHGGRVNGATFAARQFMGWGRDGAPLPDSAFAPEPGQANASFDDAERQVVRTALAATQGNVTAASRALGISRATLHRKIRALGLGAPS